MEKEPKYSLSEVSKEQSDSFMKEFQELLNKHSLYYEPVPQFTRDSLTSPWKIQCQILLQKKTEIVEPTVEKGIPSPFSNNEPTKED